MECTIWFGHSWKGWGWHTDSWWKRVLWAKKFKNHCTKRSFSFFLFFRKFIVVFNITMWKRRYQTDTHILQNIFAKTNAYFYFIPERYLVREFTIQYFITKWRIYHHWKYNLWLFNKPDQLNNEWKTFITCLSKSIVQRC